jgi:hypothetical protein
MTRAAERTRPVVENVSPMTICREGSDKGDGDESAERKRGDKVIFTVGWG